MPSLFINGEWVASGSGECSPVINPSDATVVTDVDVATDEQVQAAIGAARHAFDRTDWSCTPTAERAALLDAVAGLIDRDLEEMARLETLNTGKQMRESRWDMTDVARVFRYYADLADKEAGRLVDTGNPNALSRIVREPISVCGLIGPWNYPLLQMSWKIAPALAAGNTTVMKPARLTPLSTIHLTRLFEEAGVPPGVVNLVLGPGERVGQALADSPDVDMVSLTGGLDAARSLLRGAAGNIKRVALELGGKSPKIIFADADFETVVDNALTAAFVHSGQVCSAGCRQIVQDQVYDRFVAEVGRRAELIRLGAGTDPATETGALISAAHRAKVARYVELGIAEGARLVAGGSPTTRPMVWPAPSGRPTQDAPSGSPLASVTGRSGSTITTPTSPRRNGAASSNPGSGASWVRAASTSTARPSTSGRTCRPARPAGSAGSNGRARRGARPPTFRCPGRYRR